MQLNEKYSRENFLHFLEQSFLPSFKRDVRPINTNGLSNIHKAYSLGRDEKLDLQIFEFHSEGALNNRIALTKEAFNLMKSSATFNGLAVFYSDTKDDWRLSLMTANPERTEKGNVTMAYSNPRRYSYFLGPNSKINTPTKFLLNKDKITDFKDLKGRFSIEVVNKEFYKQISESFTKLVGGTVTKGKTKIKYDALLKMPFIQDQSQKCLEFAVRLIGRIIFCWFLREKISKNGKSLMPKELLSLEAVKKNEDYYHKILEPIFFEVLNKHTRSRKDRYIEEPFISIPYLNGGLFSPQYDDHFSYNGDQAINHNILIVPDKWFEEFFGILETYNFTIDENISFDEELSIDPEMLGRIFENLLAEINPETGESARKSTGSYYTPRPIVDYMVDESLALYLQTKTNIDEEKIKAVVSYNLDDDLLYPLNEEEKIKVIDALEEVKILDPACGSGAFPIGALQKIVFILQQLDPEGQIWFQKQIKNTVPEIKRVIEREFKNKNFDYIRKLGIIRENIYGVDIQPIATEISRLRCFLTLIVDESVHDELENRGIEPLPNLDFKFVTANSLIGLPEAKDKGQMGLFEDDEGIRELKNLRDMFFTASGQEREQLKLQFVQAQNRMFQKVIKHGLAGHAELTTTLTTWEPFSHESSPWFDPEWMFGMKGGFDIVIANPPYIGEKGHKDVFQEIKVSKLKNYYHGRMDIFYFFFHLALNILKNDGITSFITTNYYVTAHGAIKLRQDFKTRATVRALINFNELKIFEAAQGQHNMITILTNNYRQNIEAKNCLVLKPGVATTDILNEIFLQRDIGTEYYRVKQNEIYDGDECYIRISGISDNNPTQNLLNKIKQQGNELSYICNVNNGLRSGIDSVKIDGKKRGVFVLSEEEVLKINCKNEGILKKYYKNSDINSYFTKNFTDKYIIYSTKETNIKNFPKINKHLELYKEIILKKRWKEDVPWYALVRSRNKKIFESEKIVSPQRSNSNTFGYSKGEWFAGSDVFFITKKQNQSGLNMKYILGLLNSKLYYFWLYHRGKRKGNTLELIGTPIKEIPIKKISEPEQQPFIDIVDKILAITNDTGYMQNADKQAEIKEYETQIDKLVYKLYDLSAEEKSLVEGAK